MAVGVAIASGLADAGLGVRAAANALALDFIPIAAEQYDLLYHRSFLESVPGKRLMDILNSAAFKSAVTSLGGYDTERCGEILYRQ